MSKIYILSTYTGTALSYLIKKITKVPYPHVSVGVDERLEEVYSFGRRYVSNPIFAGFVREYIDGGLYKKKENTMCRVYSIDVDELQYKSVRDTLDYFIENKEEFKYDSKALIRFLYKEPVESENKYVCSQFVSYVLEQAGIQLFEKSFSSVTPLDFYSLDTLKIEYEGLLSEYRNHFNMMVEKEGR